jgi:hypothetical protein
VSSDFSIVGLSGSDPAWNMDIYLGDLYFRKYQSGQARTGGIFDNSIQFYLHANVTAQRPITNRARVEKKKHTHRNKNKSKAVLIIIITTIITIVSLKQITAKS